MFWKDLFRTLAKMSKERWKGGRYAEERWAQREIASVEQKGASVGGVMCSRLRQPGY